MKYQIGQKVSVPQRFGEIGTIEGTDDSGLIYEVTFKDYPASLLYGEHELEPFNEKPETKTNKRTIKFRIWAKRFNPDKYRELSGPIMPSFGLNPDEFDKMLAEYVEKYNEVAAQCYEWKMVYPENNEETFRELDGEDVLMQFAGLLDKNGREIYEGDLVKTDFTEDLQEIYFDNRTMGYRVGGFSNFLHEKYLEVVGNIFENLELVSIQNLVKDCISAIKHNDKTRLICEK